jgi:hypothetical protein
MDTIVNLNPKLGKLVKRIRFVLEEEPEWSEQRGTGSGDHDEGDTKNMLSEDEDGNEEDEDDEDECCDDADGERELFVDTLCLVPNLKALDISDCMDMGAWLDSSVECRCHHFSRSAFGKLSISEGYHSLYQRRFRLRVCRIYLSAARNRGSHVLELG